MGQQIQIHMIYMTKKYFSCFEAFWELGSPTSSVVAPRAGHGLSWRRPGCIPFLAANPGPPGPGRRQAGHAHWSCLAHGALDILCAAAGPGASSRAH